MRYLIYILPFLLWSCGPEVIYEEKIKVTDPWSYDEDMVYIFDVIDTTQKYNLIYELTHSKEFKYQNLYVQISTTYPNGRKVEDQVSLQIANKKGEFYGKCFTNCSLDIGLQEKFRFKDLGKHTIAISQYSRIEKLQGIKSGTLVLIESEE